MRATAAQPSSSTTIAPWTGRIRNALIILGVAATIVSVALWAGWVPGFSDAPSESLSVEATADAASASVPHNVAITPEKREAAGILCEEVRSRSLQPVRIVPGTVTYDAARHLTITAPVDSIIKQVDVQPGQEINEGQPLAVLSSEQVGLARNEVAHRAQELSIAQRDAEWAESVQASIEQLLQLLANAPSWSDMQRQLESLVVGESGEKLLSAYSRLLLARSMLDSSADLIEQGALSTRVIDQRRSALEIAEAEYRAACQTCRFESRQKRDQAQAALQESQRLLEVAQQKLASLVGPSPVAQFHADSGNTADGNDINDFTLCSPRTGRMEELLAVPGLRVTAGQPLFTVADTTVMWVSAEIHERDWAAMDVAPHVSFQFQVPALGDQLYPSQSRFVGPVVAASTRAAALVGQVDNEDKRLRSGMFAWVHVPIAAARDVLAIPAGAVMQHEYQPFVFVPSGENVYRRHDVQLGIEADGWVEIQAGLDEGQQVVTGGAFFLKSELLLEREE